MEEENKYNMLLEAFVKDIHWRAKIIEDEWKQAVSKLQSLERDKRILLHYAKNFNIPPDNSYFSSLLLGEKEKNNDIDRLIDSVGEYINTEYDKGKYQGREIRAIFGKLFQLISPEAYAKFNEKY